jgi:hypothetical protein
MRISMLVVGLMLAMLAGSAFGQSCPPPTTGIPPLTGRLVYESSVGELYIYDFLCATTSTMPTQIPIDSWNLHEATNPVFSPDGQAVVFRAVDRADDASHIYYWVIGAASPTNLTGSMGNLNNQDVKFSPDGFSMVWKQTSGISIAAFALDDTGAPQISHVRQLAPGTRNTSSEASGPTFSPDGQLVYFFTGSACAPPMQIQQVNVTGAPVVTTAFSPQTYTQLNGGSYFYYPAVDYTTNKFFYVTGAVQPFFGNCPPAPKQGPDRIFYYPNANAISGTASEFDAVETTVDKSDPAPIDGDYFIYSKDTTGIYGLYLGQLSTGKSWDLAPLNVNIHADVNMLGANYTAKRPLGPTTFGLGGANYHATSGGCQVRC